MHRMKCPSCGHRLKYGDEHVGKKARCQKCGSSILLSQTQEHTQNTANETAPLAPLPPPEPLPDSVVAEQAPGSTPQASKSGGCPKCGCHVSFWKRDLFTGMCQKCAPLVPPPDPATPPSSTGKWCCKCRGGGQAKEYDYHAARSKTETQVHKGTLIEIRGILNQQDTVCDRCIQATTRLNRVWWVLTYALIGGVYLVAFAVVGVGDTPGAGTLIGFCFGFLLFSSVAYVLLDNFAPLGDSCGQAIALRANRRRLQEMGFRVFGRGTLTPDP